jgi:RIO kinase 2
LFLEYIESIKESTREDQPEESNEDDGEEEEGKEEEEEEEKEEEEQCEEGEGSDENQEQVDNCEGDNLRGHLNPGNCDQDPNRIQGDEQTLPEDSPEESISHPGDSKAPGLDEHLTSKITVVPHSGSPSPGSIARKVAALELAGDVKNKVASDLSRSRVRQQRKHHSKRSTRQAGRPQGSKAKQDKTIKFHAEGFWD